MKKLLLISNPSVLGKNLENILKQNYHTDFISTVPKQIGSIPFNSYNALLLDFTLLHEYSLIICKTAKKHFPNIIVLFLCATNIPEQIILDFYEAGADDHYIRPSHHQHFYRKNWISYLVTIIQPQSMKTAT